MDEEEDERNPVHRIADISSLSLSPKIEDTFDTSSMGGGITIRVYISDDSFRTLRIQSRETTCGAFLRLVVEKLFLMHGSGFHLTLCSIVSSSPLSCFLSANALESERRQRSRVARRVRNSSQRRHPTKQQPSLSHNFPTSSPSSPSSVSTNSSHSMDSIESTFPMHSLRLRHDAYLSHSIVRDYRWQGEESTRTEMCWKTSESLVEENKSSHASKSDLIASLGLSFPTDQSDDDFWRKGHRDSVSKSSCCVPIRILGDEEPILSVLGDESPFSDGQVTDWSALIRIFDLQYRIYFLRIPLMGTFPLYRQDDVLVDLVFKQGLVDVLHMRFGLDEVDAVALCGLVVCHTFGSFNEDAHHPGFLRPRLPEFLPPQLLFTCDEDAWAAALGPTATCSDAYLEVCPPELEPIWKIWEIRLLRTYQVLSDTDLNESFVNRFIILLHEIINWKCIPPQKKRSIHSNKLTDCLDRIRQIFFDHPLDERDRARWHMALKDLSSSSDETDDLSPCSKATEKSILKSPGTPKNVFRRVRFSSDLETILEFDPPRTLPSFMIGSELDRLTAGAGVSALPRPERKSSFCR